MFIYKQYFHRCLDIIECKFIKQQVSFTTWGEGASLALVGHRSSDGVTIKMPYGVDVLLHRPDLHPVFSYWFG